MTNDDLDDEDLYHVTLYSNLAGITDDGLRAGGQGIGSRALDAHRRGKVFMTEAEGISFWAERMENFVNDRYDDVREAEAVPVVLRFAEPDAELEEDAIGTQDAGAGAFYCRCIIDPDEITVWDGKEWTSIEDWESIPWDAGIDEEGYLVWDSPLIPDMD
ncbi:MAG: hypothetical protein R3322_00225 [Kiloniellales bacterium]|nr:hypothetical protein [Kiloniellales bacterium]